MITVEHLIQFYELLPHPEGGFYKETYRSGVTIDATALPVTFNGRRNIATAIYFLLHGRQFSAFHRIKSDEIWHFYAGGPLLIYVIDNSGKCNIIHLGNNITKGETMQAMVPAGSWFASKPSNYSDFSFVGCTVSPGFDFEDFELAKAAELSAQFPQHASLIQSLCRQ